MGNQPFRPIGLRSCPGLQRAGVMSGVIVLLSLCYWPSLSGQLIPKDCNPKRNCDATRDCTLRVDNRDCSLKGDTRDCEPHWACPDCAWYDVPCDARKLGCETDKGRYKASCEAAKSAQNQAYAAEKLACETAKGAQDRVYEAEKAACETRKSGEKLDCERIKTQERLACEAGLAGPYSCLAAEVIGALRTKWQDPVTTGDEWTALVTTPFKGLVGWQETACAASGIGRLYHPPARSQDGFWTVDIELLAFEVNGIKNTATPRFIRLEVKPSRFGGGRAHDFFDTQTVSVNETVKFQGPVFVDKDGPFLEVHPGDVFEKVAAGGVKSLVLSVQ